MSRFKSGLTNFSFLMAGSVFSQIVSFIGFLYIARKLGPANYGVYCMVGAFAGLFTIATFSGLNKVVLRKCSRNMDEMADIMESTIGIRNLFSILAWFTCIVVSLFVNYDVQAKFFVVLISFELLTFAGIRESLNTIYQAVEQMQYIAILNAWRTIMSVCLSIVFLSMGYGIFALILIQLLVAFVTLILNYRISKKIMNFKILSNIQFDWPMLKQGLVFSAISFFNTLSNKIDLVMLSFLATPLEVGLYALPYKMVKRVNTIKNLVSTSFFPIFVKTFSEGPIKNSILLYQSIFLTAPLLLIAIVIGFFAEDFILFFFGESYRASAIILKVLVFYIVVNAISMVFDLSLQATNNEKISLYATISQSVLNILLNFLFFHYYGVIGIAFSTLLSTSLKALVIIGFAMHKFRSKNGII